MRGKVTERTAAQKRVVATAHDLILEKNNKLYMLNLERNRLTFPSLCGSMGKLRPST
jgi:hypothetical protein